MEENFIGAKKTKVKMVLGLDVWIEEVLDILGKTIVECFFFFNMKKTLYFHLKQKRVHFLIFSILFLFGILSLTLFISLVLKL